MVASEKAETGRLNRLIESGRCEVTAARKYADELKRVARDVVNAELVDRQSRFFKALADETRLGIIRLLEVREMCVCEIMVALDLTQPTASHHLGILEGAGLVKGRKEGKWVFYGISDHRLVKNIDKLKAPQR